MPWIICKFSPTPRFEEFRLLFTEELSLLNDDKMEAWEEAYSHIDALNLTLIDLKDNQTIKEFILHIKGDSAWFSYLNIPAKKHSAES